MPPSSPARPGNPPALLLDAWNAFQAEVELRLVTLAHALDTEWAREPEGVPDEHPLGLSALAPLAATGADGQGWRLWQGLRAHVEVERLRQVAPGMDAGVAVLAAAQRVEQAQCGPAGGGLWPGATGHSAAWISLCAEVQADSTVALWERARDESVRARRADWPAPLQERLEALFRALLEDASRAGTALVRLAAADRSGEHGFLASVPVAAALDWGIEVRVDATLDGAWMVQARRVAIAAEPAPPDAVSLTMQVMGPSARVVLRRLAAGVDALTWYETQPLGESVVVWAEREGVGGGVRGHG
jgi:hypothetical protein